jgi:hypothetical protein
MLMVMTFCSPPYSASASASAVSVLPTPEVPAQHEHADGLVGVVEPGARGLDALGDHVQAMVAGRSRAGPGVSASRSTVSISFLTMRPTGMPVQSATTLRPRPGSRPGQDQRRSPCRAAQLGLQAGSRVQLAGQQGGARCARRFARFRRWPAGLALDRAGARAIWPAAPGCGRPAPSRPASVSPAPSRRALGAQLRAGIGLPRADVSMPMAASRAMMSSSVCSASMRRRQSSTSAGVACWLTATRAQAVSSRLTALSGSWRAGM